MPKLIVDNEEIIKYIPQQREDGNSVLLTNTDMTPVVSICSKERIIHYLEKAIVCFAAEPIIETLHSNIIFCGNHKTVSCLNYSMHTIVHEGIQNTCDTLMEATRTFEEISVIISLGVLDAFYNPSSTSLGGMTTRELLYFIRRLRYIKNITSWAIIDCTNENIKLAGILAAEML